VRKARFRHLTVRVVPAALPGYLRRTWGPHWAVSLCGRDHTAEVAIGVPDGPVDVRIVNGMIVRPRILGGGEDFNEAGVPPRFPFGFPVTPEQAVGVRSTISCMLLGQHRCLCRFVKSADELAVIRAKGHCDG